MSECVFALAEDAEKYRQQRNEARAMLAAHRAEIDKAAEELNGQFAEGYSGLWMAKFIERLRALGGAS